MMDLEKRGAEANYEGDPKKEKLKLFYEKML